MRTLKKAGIVIKPHAPSVETILKDLVEYFRDRGLQCVLEDTAAGMLGLPGGLPRQEIPGASDLVIVLGGDGTLLSIAPASAAAGVPVMGINLGRLGFLTEVPVSEMFMALDAFLSDGRELISPRWLLDVRSRAIDSQCLNDVVITRGALSRMIEYAILVDGNEVAALKADGLIVSTPTGSTAYSLSAGGPILHPQTSAILLTPICPHTLTFRPFLVSSSSEIDVRMLAGDGDVFLTLDGQRGGALTRDDVIRIRKTSRELQLVRSPRRNYFDLVKEKLGWGG